MTKGSDFLKKKYNLHASREVESAAQRRERRSRVQGKPEKVPQKPGERVQNYLDRFSEILNREDIVQKQEGIAALKELLHRRFVIKPQEVPEGYFELQRRILREQGHGDIELSDELKEQAIDVIRADQTSSMDKWIDYMTSDDALYPDWLKYWAMRSMLGLAEYDKEEKKFPKRTKGTTKPFPDLNREALALVLDAVNKKVEGNIITLDQLDNEQREVFNDLLDTENFAKLYAWAVEQLQPASQELLENIKGKWVKYPKGSDPSQLVKTLQGHSTGWCTAGESTAQAQLKQGDFYVYYSEDENGKYTIPRAAIRMQGDTIREVRGIAPEQNLDPYIGEVVHEKLGAFGDEGKKYQKRAEDMKRLTEIEKKTKNNQALSKDDLIFLYELKQPIEGFGYNKDPRINEIRSPRDPMQDAPIVFECEPDQIASNKEEVNDNTKAYIGELYPGIFDDLPRDIEHIYTSFPEQPIRFHEVTIGGKDSKQLQKEMLEQGDQITDWAKGMMNRRAFTTSKEQQLELVEVSVKDLGFPQGATRKDIYERAQELGLEVVPAEVGPNLRLQYKDQPMGNYIAIGMEPIADSSGLPKLFNVDHDSDGRFLGSDIWLPGFHLNDSLRFVFSRRPRTSA